MIDKLKMHQIKLRIVWPSTKAMLQCSVKSASNMSYPINIPTGSQSCYIQHHGQTKNPIEIFHFNEYGQKALHCL